jgi:hypothetical protein
VHFDPETIGQPMQSPDAENDDEFGYAVALGHVLLDSATDDDVLVGARGAKQGAGRVSGDRRGRQPRRGKGRAFRG